MGPTADEEEAENGSGHGGITAVETVTRAVAEIAGLPESGWAVEEALLRPRPVGEAPQPALRRAQGRRWRRLPWRIPDPKHGALVTILERHLKVKERKMGRREQEIGSERSGDGSRRSGAEDGRETA